MKLEDYLKELESVELLAPDEEERLWAAFKYENDGAARHRIIEAYQPLVFKNALPYRFLENVMDVVQEGTVGLIEAAESFDPKRGVAFSLFAFHRIRGRMQSFLKKEGGAASAFAEEDAEALAERVMDPAASVAEQAESHELIARVREALARLPAKERLVLEQMYMGSGEASEVAEMLHVSISHIYRLQKNGVRRVRGMLSRFMCHWKS